MYVVDERAGTKRKRMLRVQPLIYRSLQRTRLDAGRFFDFATRQHNRISAVINVDGSNADPD